MLTQQLTFFNDDPVLTVPNMPLKERVERAIALLQENEPDDGYYLAFSGGKDSCVCKKLLQLSGCHFESFYNVTTIDPPELIYFIREHHQDVKWNNPKYGNMFHRIATVPKIPPTRNGRWCCQDYKECGGNGRVKVFGVRAAESRARKKRWSENSIDKNGDKAICQLAFWEDNQVWEFIQDYEVQYCKLYNEGFKRIGCVGCPLAPKANQTMEFERWPKFREGWKRAIIANWENWHDIPNTKTGKPRYQAKFKSGYDFWRWWLTEETPDYIYGDCQPMLLWTNEPGFSDGE